MKRMISLALCAVLALALCLPAAAFSDVTGEEWYADAVAWCAEQGLMDGLPGDVFSPDGAVTRAMLATVLWRLAQRPAVAADAGFSDVAEGAWYDVAVRWAKAAGVTDGMGDGRFGPDEAVTREMLATFLHRFAGAPAAEGEAFDDSGKIDVWAAAAARWAKSAGVMQGRGENDFDPLGGATRAELAPVLMNYAERVGVVPTVREEIDARSMPVGVAAAADGTLYVTDAFYKAVWRVTPDGSERAAGAVSVADAQGEPVGGYLDGAAAEALFGSPWGIAPFLGGWAVADRANNAVRLLRGDTVATLNGVDFSEPTGLAADDAGNLYAANTGNGTVVRITPKGASEIVAEGLAGPTGLCWSDGALYICETDADRVLKLSGGACVTFAGSGENGFADGAAAEAAFSGPQGLCAGPDGTIYVADTVNGAVRAVRAGQVTTLLAPPEGREIDGWPVAPTDLALVGGTLTVCDRFARKLITLAAS